MRYDNADITFVIDKYNFKKLYAVELDKFSVPSIGDTVTLDQYNGKTNVSSSDGSFKVIDKEFKYCQHTTSDFCSLNIRLILQKIK